MLYSRLIFAALVLLALPAGAAEKKKKPKPEPLPPRPAQPIPQELQIERGGQTDIYLRIYGRKGAPVTFLVRKPPQFGRLTEVEALEQEVARVRYTPPMDRQITTDRFEYAARDGNGVSAAVPVVITITDAPPLLAVPAEQRFARRLVGESETLSIEVENRGGTVAEGELFVTPPWQLDSPKAYRLEPGTRRVFRVTFAPEKAGSYAGELTYSSQPGTATTLLGAAVAPLAVQPEVLGLAPELTTLVRAGALELTNHTNEPLTIRAELPPELQTDDGFVLAAGETRTFIIRSAPGHPGAVHGTVRFSAGRFFAEAKVSAAPLPAIIRAAEPSVNFGRIAAATPLELLLQNVGGTAGRATLRATGPLQVPAQVPLAAGQSVRVPVTLAGGHTGPVEAEIEIRDGTSTQRVPVRGAVGVPVPRLAPAAPAPRPRAAASSEERGWSAHNTEIEKAIDPRRIVRVVALNGTACTLEWHADLSAARSFTAELRELRLRDDKVTELWHAHPGLRTERRASRVIGTLEQLAPGTRYTVRIRARDASGAPGPVVVQTSFRTPQPDRRGVPIGWPGALGLAAATLVLITLWQRLRRSTPAASPGAMKKTQKFV